MDTAVTTLKMANGALAVIENSRQAVYGYDQRVEVFGSRGSAEAGNETANRVTFSGAGRRSPRQPSLFLPRTLPGVVSVPNSRPSSPVSVRTRDPPVGGRDGLMSVLVGLAAARSMAENRPVKVEAS